MRKRKIIKYSLLLFSAVLIFLIIYSNHGLKTLYGGNTKEVEVKNLATPRQPIIINNISVLSKDGNSFLEKHTVTIKDGIIIKVDSIPSILDDAIIINGEGKYLIPGLIDSHVHLFKSPNDLLLYVANGITHIREMIGEQEHLRWKEEIMNGRIGPSIYVASPRFGSFSFIQGWFMSYTQGFENTTNAADAKKKVIEYYKMGYDGIKIYSHLNKECYKSISEISDSLGMDMIGHIPFNVEFSDLWKSNQREVTHFEEIMNALNREFGHFRNDKEAFLNFIDEKSDSIAQALIKKNIAITSTLWGMESLYRQKTDLETILNEVELEYANPGIIEGHLLTPQGGLGWLPDVNRVRFPNGLTEEESIGRGDYWKIYIEACQRVGKNLSKRGVKILVGTDANLSIKVPGFSLHDELKALHKIGMSNSDVLRAATLTPAEWLGIKSGKIEKNYTANLVILEKNPLNNIENTRSINQVILNGRILDREFLDNILQLVKQANNSSRKKDITNLISKE